MPQENQTYIIVIGAANADITGISSESLSFNDSTPGQVTLGAGGVGRNIAENFARLSADDDIKTYLLSAVGDDLHGEMVIAESQQAGIDISHCQILAGHQTASYISIIDSNGEMRSAVNDMSIVDQINVDYLAQKAELITEAKLIIVDVNLTADAINFICQNFNHIPIFIDTVSSVKAYKVTPNIEHIHCLTPNINEAEILSSTRIRQDEDLAKAAKYFHSKNIGNLFITLGKRGVYISSIVDDIVMAEHFPAYEGDILNANGAGDAFMAGLIYAFVNKMSVRQQAEFAQACAFLTAQSEHTINKKIDQQMVVDFMESRK